MQLSRHLSCLSIAPPVDHIWIVHVPSGLVVQVKNIKTKHIVLDEGFGEENCAFRILGDGRLQHVKTGWFLAPEKSKAGSKLVLSSDYNASQMFEHKPSGHLVHQETLSIVQPKRGYGKEGKGLVIAPNEDLETRFTFAFQKWPGESPPAIQKLVVRLRCENGEIGIKTIASKEILDDSNQEDGRPTGLFVTHVSRRTAALAAGIQDLDLMVQVDGINLRESSVGDLMAVLHGPSRIIEITIIRDKDISSCISWRSPSSSSLLSQWAGGAVEWAWQVGSKVALPFQHSWWYGGSSSSSRKTTTTAAPSSTTVFGADILAVPSTPPAAFSQYCVEEPGIPWPLACFMQQLETEDILQTEGIFRMAGRRHTVTQAKELIDSGVAPNFTEMYPHDIVDLLKLYIKSLPKSLIPYSTAVACGRELYSLSKEKSGDDDASVAVLSRVVQEEINNEYHTTLARLLSFLHNVSQEAAHNKMNPNNLACIDMVVNTLIFPEADAVVAPQDMLADAMYPKEFLQHMLEVNDKLNWKIQPQQPPS